MKTEPVGQTNPKIARGRGKETWFAPDGYLPQNRVEAARWASNAVFSSTCRHNSPHHK